MGISSPPESAYEREGKDTLLGDSFSVADLNVASVLMVFTLARIDLSNAPNAKRWLERCLSRPAIKRAQES